MNQFLRSFLVLALIGSSSATIGQSSLFMTSNQDNTLRVADTSSLSISSSNSYNNSSNNISQSNGLAIHPCTGELFAVVQAGAGARSLAIIDTNGNANVLGSMGDLVASIAFDDNGTLYAVTGDGANTSETLYTVDLEDGSMTFEMSLGNGSDGEAIAFNPDDGLMYHWSGWSSLAGIVFESINLNTNTVSNIGMTGSVSPTSIRAAAYIGGGQFLVSGHANDGLHLVSTTGAIVSTGVTTTFGVKGLAMENPDAIGIIGTADGLCPGDTATLTGAAGSAYQWYVDGQLISGATSQTYETSIAGHYNCIITTANCTDSSIGGFLLDSFDLPTVQISGNDSGFCPGGVIALQGSQGGSSQWYQNGIPIFGQTSNSILVSEEGWYNMTKTNLDGCTDSAAIGFFVEEYEAPDVNLGDDDGICVGDSITLDAGSFPGASYIWVPFQQGQTLSTSDTGSYIAIVTSSEGCVGTDTIYIGYFPDPVVDLGNDTLVCEEATVTLDAGTGQTSYTWSTGGSGQTEDITYGNEAEVTVKVTVVNSFGCSAEDSLMIEFEDCLGINGVEDPALSLYPNPSHGTIMLSDYSVVESITVFNALGSVVSSVQVAGTTPSIELGDEGLYFVEIVTLNGTTQVERVVVQ